MTTGQRTRFSRRSVLALIGLGSAGLLAAGCQAVPRAAASLAQPSVDSAPFGELVVPGRIYYTRNGDIWRWSSGSSQQVSRGAKYEGPSLSPDGQKIAVTAQGQNHSDVVLLNTAGERLATVTSNLSNQSIKSQAWGRKPVWSPDGRRIAYISDQGPMAGDMKSLDMSLFVIGADGTGLKKLIVEEPFSGGVDWPTWSPDGTQLAYVSFDSGPSQIQLYNLSTTEWATITNHEGGAYDPAFSPDGKYIAYVVRDKGKNDVFVMLPDGSEPERLTETGSCRAPCWSPDGQQLAYISIVGGTFEIVAARVTAGERMTLTESRQLTRGESVDAPSGLSWTI